jgi:hypothetical protein
MPPVLPAPPETDPSFHILKSGRHESVNVRKLIERRIRHAGKAVNATGDVNAVVAANINEGSSQSHVSHRSRTRIVQRSGRTTITEETDPRRGSG